MLIISTRCVNMILCRYTTPLQLPTPPANVASTHAAFLMRQSPIFKVAAFDVRASFNAAATPLSQSLIPKCAAAIKAIGKLSNAIVIYDIYLSANEKRAYVVCFHRRSYFGHARSNLRHYWYWPDWLFIRKHSQPKYNAYTVDSWFHRRLPAPALPQAYYSC